MKRKILVLSIGVIITGASVYASQSAIVSANNQAFIDGLLDYNRVTYGANRPGDTGVPLYNSQSWGQGARLGFTKMYGCVYSQFALGFDRTPVNYSDYKLDDTTLSNGNSFTLSLDLRLGYSFFPQSNFAVTPYLLGGYFNNQLDSGGYSAPFIPVHYGGSTLMMSSYYYGIGVLGQWAVTPQWVLDANFQFGTQANPAVSGSVNNFAVQPLATTTYQHWYLSALQFWELDLASNYRFDNHVNVRAGVGYGHADLNGEDAVRKGIFPARQQHDWVLKLGLGYDLADLNPGDTEWMSVGRGAICSANNQGAIRAGVVSQNFSGGTTETRYHQTGIFPSVGVVFSKTWGALYTQIAAREALGKTSQLSNFVSSPAHNTFFDAAGKLGLQFGTTCNTALTPYATVGYHRWFQATQGTPDNIGMANAVGTSFVDGVSERYQNGWYGGGLLAQWVALPRLVLSAEGSLGRTFNPGLHSWAPLGLTLETSYPLGTAPYQMAALGGDYAVGRNWHIQANVSYWHYRYNPSNPNALDISTIAGRTHQVNVDLGVGYSFA